MFLEYLCVIILTGTLREHNELEGSVRGARAYGNSHSRNGENPIGRTLLIMILCGSNFPLT